MHKLNDRQELNDRQGQKHQGLGSPLLLFFLFFGRLTSALISPFSLLSLMILLMIDSSL